MSFSFTIIITMILMLSSPPPINSQLRGSLYFEWNKNPINYPSLGFGLTGHTLTTLNYHLVTQCSMACLKDPRCLSYNFHSILKICQLNDITHLTNSVQLQPADGWQYFLRDAYSINQKADPCLSTPCLNFGTCLSRADNSFICFCPSQWTGPTCNVKIDIAWASWSAWSDCSEKCGDGVRSRRRTCINRTDMSQKSVEMCYGMDQQLEGCRVKDCPYWSQWSDWSACTNLQQCGDGTSSRVRRCINSDSEQNCFGLSVENRTCPYISCNAPVLLKPETGKLFGDGSLQIYDEISSSWYYVCADVLTGGGWTQANGDVVCRQMGFPHGAFSATKAPVDQTTVNADKYLLVNFNCVGKEPSLNTCPHSTWLLGTCTQKVVLSCVVDGRWSDWSSWSSCSVTCANGTSLRSRNCTSPQPRYGGDNCLGDGQQSKVCTNSPCPVDAYWTLWTDWSECTKSCGGGDQGRGRTCIPGKFNGKDCSGDGMQNRTCNVQPCPVDGYWSDWGQWGLCNATCGGGQQIRTRSCVQPQYGGLSCTGLNVTSQSCNTQSCAVDGYWLEWGQWASCNVTCGGGQRIRSRFCVEPLYGGVACSGGNVDHELCNVNPCPIDGLWMEWGDWSSCNVTCGGGMRVRTRVCNPPKYGGKDCPTEGGTSVDFCNDDPCIINGQWSLWSRWMDCTVTCGSGTERRYRECSAPANGGSTCTGASEEFRDCNATVCPTPAEWTDWSPWSRCSLTCGNSGIRVRTRMCNQTSDGLNSLPCLNPGANNDTKACNQFSCTPGVQSCQEVVSRGLEESSFVSILLNGIQSNQSVIVLCYMDNNTVSTIVNSSYETDFNVTIGLNTPRMTYKVVYSSNGVQIGMDDVKTLVYNSKECRQQVSWKCKNFPMNSPTGNKLVYWKNQYSDNMAYWGDTTAVAAGTASMGILCSCGEKSTCPPYKCACDRNDTTWSQDSGLLSNKYDLPLTEVDVTDTGYRQQAGMFMVGSLICI